VGCGGCDRRRCFVYVVISLSKDDIDEKIEDQDIISAFLIFFMRRMIRSLFSNAKFKLLCGSHQLRKEHCVPLT
jgi:hypothetical protein